MAKKYVVRAPLSQSEYLAHLKSQAEERQRRGLLTFTRESRREEIMGETEGESKLSKTHRASQVKRRKGK